MNKQDASLLTGEWAPSYTYAPLGSPPPLHTHFADSSYYASTSPPLIFLYSYLADRTMASDAGLMPP